MIWSTGPPGDLLSVAHLMPSDLHGRPGAPLCGLNSDGLYFRRDVEWSQVPNTRRCEECDALGA